MWNDDKALTGMRASHSFTGGLALFLVLPLLAALWLFAGPRAWAAPSEARVALVIGNGAYPTGPLTNPPNDSRLMAATLRDVGFDVIERQNTDQKAMKRAITEFGLRLRAAGADAVGLFFFAGHGLQINGENYLVPVGAEIASEADVDLETVAASSVLRQMEAAGNRINMVILDACRDNPYKRSFRSTSRGLARLEAPRGSFVAYATAPGDVAADGAGSNSPFTTALSRAMKAPGLSVEAMFKRVRVDVLKETGNRQTPWDSSSLTGDFFFMAKAETPPPPAAPVVVAPVPNPPAESASRNADSMAVELTFWQSVKDSRDPADLEEYLSQFPNGRFSGLARNRLAEIKRVQQASVANAPPPRPPFPPPEPEPAPPAPPPVVERPQPPPAVSPSALTECDRLAAPPGAGFGPGVPMERLSAPEAVRACQKAVEESPDEVRFWRWLGRAFEKSDNLDAAFLWFRQAAEQGVAEDQNTTGRMLQDGRGVERNDGEAVAWYRKAAEQGHADAQNNLGFMLQVGRGITANAAEAARWYRKAAEQGHGYAQNNLGLLFQHGQGVPRDAAEAVRWYRKSAEQGNAEGQNHLGVMYENGNGVPQNDGEAVRWYRKAAEQDSFYGQDNLGRMYQNGRGVARSDSEAMRWYRKAADRGYAVAQNHVGIMYQEGQGIPRSDAEAVKWYRLAADQGLADGQNNLGLMYQNGRGLARNDGEAVKWYRKAADQGHADAQNNLGVMYQTGKGVTRNDNEARRWYRLSAEQGNEYARRNLDALQPSGGDTRAVDPQRGRDAPPPPATGGLRKK